MQKEIHPKYFSEAKFTCVCGNSWTAGSTKEAVHVEICSNCHPFYTGGDKVLDAAGRVQKFIERQAKTAVAKASKK